MVRKTFNGFPSILAHADGRTVSISKVVRILGCLLLYRSLVGTSNVVTCVMRHLVMNGFTPFSKVKELDKCQHRPPMVNDLMFGRDRS